MQLYVICRDSTTPNNRYRGASRYLYSPPNLLSLYEPKTLIPMKRILLTIALLTVSLFYAIAQNPVYLGTAGYSTNHIYEDGATDDGTRYIMSGLFHAGPYMISLCEFIPTEGESWYSLAVESKEFIPRNGLMVFVFKDASKEPIVLGQQVSENTTTEKISYRLSPHFFFGLGSGSDFFLATHETTKSIPVSFGMYDLSENELLEIINGEMKFVRIANRATYYEFSKVMAKRIAADLSDAKKHVDARALLSRNTILEGIDK